MAVYVDDMFAEYRGMRMCHMLADDPRELDAMAREIGVAAKWKQNAGTYREHFDICMSKRRLAIQLGAIEISWKDVGDKLRERRRASP